MLTEDFQNTRQMSLAPQPQDEFDSLDTISGGQGMRLLPVFTGEAFLRVVAYPVMVELWEKKNFGRHKRRWLAEFTLAERKKISSYYAKFYKWHLIKGTPRTVSVSLDTLQLLQRAIGFFGSM